MAKKTNWIPNLRVDVEDLEQGTHGYTGEVNKEFLSRTFKDFYPRVSEGFRVEIADAANRVITVYSGVATDQNGQLVNNEESQTTSRSITLTGNATYYIEVEFTENLGNTDARAFWDPTFDNGLDTSGDILPDGRESSQNVATRRTHDWQIVDTPSTTGFQITTTPGSVRIPVAIITVAGGAITAPAATSVARTCFARTYQSGVTSIRGLNTRIFPNAFTARLGSGTANQEDVSVTANDRENGVLTLGAGTVNAHNIGERIIDQGGTVLFIDENVSMDAATGVNGGGPVPNVAGDGRVRMFQGDTEAGYALSQNPAADTGESDIQIKNLKEQVDFLASQMLEMKYGAGSRDLLGTLTPPDDFTTTAHFSRSGGILPARAHTVSVGDGVSTWGDYNTTTSGSAQAAIQAAIDALPVNGGVVFIKAGTYTITATAISIVDKPVWLIGEGRDATTITATGVVSAIDFDTATIAQEFSNMLRMDNLSVLHGAGGSTHAMTCTGASRMLVKNCRIYGINATGGSIDRSIFDHCRFRQALGTGSTIEGTFNECTFNSCYIDMDTAAAAQRAVLLSTGSAKLVFNDCIFQVNTAADAQVGLPDGVDNIVFRNCEFTTGVGVAALAFDVAGSVSDVLLDHCNVICGGGIGIVAGVTGFRASKCTVLVPADGQGITLDAVVDATISECTFTQGTTAAGTTGVAIDATDVEQLSITGCNFINCDHSIYMWEGLDVNVSDCHMKCAAGRGRSGISTATRFATPSVDPRWIAIQITSCTIQGLSDTSIASIYGIDAQATAATPAQNVSVVNCTFHSIGDTSLGNTVVSGVRFVTRLAVAGSSFFHVRVANCSFNTFLGSGTNRGIEFDEVSHATCIGNIFTNIGIISTAATICRAVEALRCPGANISNNTMRGIGHSSATLTGGVIHVGGSGQTVQTEGIVVSSNIIGLVFAATNALNGIYIEENATHITVSNNSIDNDNMGAGIFLGPEADADTIYLGNAAITGNTIKGGTYGIFVVMDEPNDFQEGCVSISGNSIDVFSAIGIFVEGDDASVLDFLSLSISGNTVRTNAAAGFETGILVTAVNSASIVGNSVHMGTTAAITNQSGIAAVLCDGLSVSSNFVRVLSTGANCRGIDLSVVGDNVINALVAANMVKITGDGTAGTIGIDGGDNGNYITSNSIETPGGLAVARTGGTTTSASTANDNREI